MIRALRQNLWWRGPLHRFIAWYLRRCGNAFHVYPYGPDGRYVVLMTEAQYAAGVDKTERRSHDVHEWSRALGIPIK